MNRRSALGLLALSVLIVLPGTSVAGRDGLLRLVDGLAMDRAVQPIPAPPFALAGLDGVEVRLADLRGRLVLLYFWTTW